MEDRRMGAPLPPVITEVLTLNLTLPIAAISVLALRVPRFADGVVIAGVMKFGALLLVPYLWVTEPSSRRSILLVWFS
jgi:hypothetical protein